jgi:2-polyprenyl-3-methyl-5-hydroxy-6-metoxy-1,4-benzoquinol methylase
METPHIDKFQQLLSRSMFASLGESIPRLLASEGAPYSQSFEDHLTILEKAFPDRPWLEWAVDGFVSMNREILREELQFRKSGLYRAKADEMEKVLDTVYNNAEVMDGFYLVGLYCTYFIWPHHWEMLGFFQSKFLGHQGAPVKTFAEFGVGHGLLSKLALTAWPDAKATLLDLSEHSIEFSRRVLTASGFADRCTFIHTDVMTAENLPHADRLVCSELLEHVPDPRKLLSRIAATLNPGARVFLTGAITAAQVDHVYLFETADELVVMVHEEGLKVLDSITLVHPNRKAEARPPRVVALIAERG